MGLPRSMMIVTIAEHVRNDARERQKRSAGRLPHLQNDVVNARFPQMPFGERLAGSVLGVERKPFASRGDPESSCN